MKTHCKECKCLDPTYKPGKSCGSPKFKGDGHCDDDNNNAACAYDGGDCCGGSVVKDYCKECKCLDPNYKPGKCCGSPKFKGDGHCDDDNNNAACAYDGGDCCGNDIHKDYCTACICLDPNYKPQPKDCDKEFAFNNCAEAFANSCSNGEYKLRSCSLANPSKCTDWRTTCNDGYTLIGYLAKNGKTRNRFDVYTKWPKQSSSRAAGSTFLFQGDIENLRLTEKVTILEGVKCTGNEAFSNDCKWVHNSETCNSDCVQKIRQSYGYQYNGDGIANDKRPPCATGKTGGSAKAGCSPYTKTSRTTLGWATDMHGTGNCWVGRGSCCSDAGGSGGCDAGDSSGKYHAMLWAKPQ